MRFSILLLVPSLVMGITDFDSCDGDNQKKCLQPGAVDCGSYKDATCSIPGGTVFGGCCIGGTADSTTPAPATAAPAAGVITPCEDRLNPLTGISDCPARAYLCKDPVYRNFMTVQCIRTCGYCKGPSKATTKAATSTGMVNFFVFGCVDLVNPMTGVSDCPNRSAYCTNALYRPLMQTQCPATCGFCTSG
ncbi:hypothetical protein PRIPAC_93959 [Pristionchus pacificus]|uniref:ShK domain-containing protein n=1 Tax=Pristionchus pacificus TaxID=54126 RepID=A0A2A6BIC0_PRIPA|nr:hypothetical protein PRIPAC_93959 [Pristionchus pacificus]|eukprot:PDM65675.1 ShK domain-containing protein [Pristionchus pacificus]